MVFLIATALIFLGGLASFRKLNTHWHFYFEGLSRRWQGDLEGAIKYYSQALSLEPQFAEAYYSRGMQNLR